jgi:Creatinine amidohydrolase
MREERLQRMSDGRAESGCDPESGAAACLWVDRPGGSRHRLLRRLLRIRRHWTARAAAQPPAPFLRHRLAPSGLRLDAYQRIVADILASLAGTAFTRVLFVNGHGGNIPGGSILQEWMNDHLRITVKWHNWGNAPKTVGAVAAIDSVASHASWMENFPWTRLAGVKLPDGQKPMIDIKHIRMMDTAGVRAYLGDGSFDGVYEKPDDQTMQVWRAGVEETRQALEGPWA